MKRILLILFILCPYVWTHAQDIRIICASPIPKPISYVVDFLQLDSLQISSFEFQRNDIKGFQVDAENSRIVFRTRLLIVLDDMLLSTKKEKKAKLSGINRDMIESIERIDKKKASGFYGKKGKHGAILIKTKKEFKSSETP